MRRHALHVFPWDVPGEEEAAAIAATGVNEVSLAVAYHSGRFLRPEHRDRPVLVADHAAVYHRPAADRWDGAELHPPLPGAWAETGIALEAVRRLRDQGLSVSAWTVMLHNSALGRARPDLTVTNAFGDRLVNALCPAQPAVRDYARRLAVEIAGLEAVDALELEALGFGGYGHPASHEKNGGSPGDAVSALLSLCWCRVCSERLASAGGDPERAAHRTREGVHRMLVEERPDPPDLETAMRELLGESAAERILAVRGATVSTLLDEIVSALPRPRSRLLLHATQSRWRTGAFAAMLGALPAEVVELVLPPEEDVSSPLPAPYWRQRLMRQIGALPEAPDAPGMLGVRHHAWGIATPRQRHELSADILRDRER